MKVIFVVVSFMVGLLIPPLRSYIRRAAGFVWSDGLHVVSCGLVALATTAAALNHLGIHPISLPGSLFMGLVFCAGFALLLRWAETHGP